MKDTLPAHQRLGPQNPPATLLLPVPGLGQEKGSSFQGAQAQYLLHPSEEEPWLELRGPGYRLCDPTTIPSGDSGGTGLLPASEAHHPMEEVALNTQHWRAALQIHGVQDHSSQTWAPMDLYWPLARKGWTLHDTWGWQWERGGTT